MDKSDEESVNDVIQLSEDDLMLQQDFCSTLEKWNGMAVETATKFLELGNTLFDNRKSKFDENESECNNLQTLLTNNTNDCDKLLHLNLEAENEESNLKKEIEDVKAQIKELEEAKTKLDNDKELDFLKKMCKASKLLTGTIFEKQGSNICGISTISGKVQHFDFDEAEIKPEHIYKELWQKVAMNLDVDK